MSSVLNLNAFQKVFQKFLSSKGKINAVFDKSGSMSFHYQEGQELMTYLSQSKPLIIQLFDDEKHNNVSIEHYRNGGATNIAHSLEQIKAIRDKTQEEQCAYIIYLSDGMNNMATEYALNNAFTNVVESIIAALDRECNIIFNVITVGNYYETTYTGLMMKTLSTLPSLLNKRAQCFYTQTLFETVLENIRSKKTVFGLFNEPLVKEQDDVKDMEDIGNLLQYLKDGPIRNSILDRAHHLIKCQKTLEQLYVSVSEVESSPDDFTLSGLFRKFLGPFVARPTTVLKSVLMENALYGVKFNTYLNPEDMWLNEFISSFKQSSDRVLSPEDYEKILGELECGVITSLVVNCFKIRVFNRNDVLDVQDIEISELAAIYLTGKPIWICIYLKDGVELPFEKEYLFYVFACLWDSLCQDKQTLSMINYHSYMLMSVLSKSPHNDPNISLITKTLAQLYSPEVISESRFKNLMERLSKEALTEQGNKQEHYTGNVWDDMLYLILSMLLNPSEVTGFPNFDQIYSKENSKYLIGSVLSALQRFSVDARENDPALMFLHTTFDINKFVNMFFEILAGASTDAGLNQEKYHGILQKYYLAGEHWAKELDVIISELNSSLVLPLPENPNPDHVITDNMVAYVLASLGLNDTVSIANYISNILRKLERKRNDNEGKMRYFYDAIGGMIKYIPSESVSNMIDHFCEENKDSADPEIIALMSYLKKNKGKLYSNTFLGLLGVPHKIHGWTPKMLDHNYYGFTYTYQVTIRTQEYMCGPYETKIIERKNVVLSRWFLQNGLDVQEYFPLLNAIRGNIPVDELYRKASEIQAKYEHLHGNIFNFKNNENKKCGCCASPLVSYGYVLQVNDLGKCLGPDTSDNHCGMCSAYRFPKTIPDIKGILSVISAALSKTRFTNTELRMKNIYLTNRVKWAENNGGLERWKAVKDELTNPDFNSINWLRSLNTDGNTKLSNELVKGFEEFLKRNNEGYVSEIQETSCSEIQATLFCEDTFSQIGESLVDDFCQSE